MDLYLRLLGSELLDSGLAVFMRRAEGESDVRGLLVILVIARFLTISHAPESDALEEPRRHSRKSGSNPSRVLDHGIVMTNRRIRDLD